MSNKLWPQCYYKCDNVVKMKINDSMKSFYNTENENDILKDCSQCYYKTDNIFKSDVYLQNYYHHSK